MPPAVERKTERVLEALRDQLEDQMIGGAGYFFEADAVTRPPTFAGNELEFFDKTSDTFVMLRPGGLSLEETATGVMTYTLEVWICAATKHRLDSFQPSGLPTPGPQTMQTRLAGDVLKAVFLDVTLGGEADNARITDVDHEVFVEDWAVVYLRGEIVYDARKEDP